MGLEAGFCLVLCQGPFSILGRVPLTAQVLGLVRPNKSLQLSSLFWIRSFFGCSDWALSTTLSSK